MPIRQSRPGGDGKRLEPHLPLPALERCLGTMGRHCQVRDRSGALMVAAHRRETIELSTVPSTMARSSADEGIDASLAATASRCWSRPVHGIKAVADFVERVRAVRVAEGFLAAIEVVGTRLAEHFPRAPDDFGRAAEPSDRDLGS
jgi:uncharacterized membrane protein